MNNLIQPLFVLESFQYLAPNIVAAFACVIACCYYWQLRHDPRMGMALWTAGLAAIWNVGSVMMRSAGTPWVGITGYELTTTAAIYASVIVLPLAVHQAGTTRPIPPFWMRVLLLYPAILIAIKWATPWMVKSYAYQPATPVSFTWPVWGPLAGVEFAFGYGGGLIAATLLAHAWSVSRNRVHTLQCGILIGLIFLPIVGSIVQTSQHGQGFTRRFGVAGISMALCALGYLFVLSKESQFALMPIARDSVVDSMQDGLIVTNSGGTIVDINPAGRRMLQAGPDTGAWHGRPVETLMKAARAAIPADGEMATIHIHGMDLEMRASAVMSQTGQIGHAYLLRDVTESSRADADLRNAKAQAEQAAVAKSEFLATVSHEIRTPLNGVIGMSTLILGDAHLSTEVREKMETLDASANSLRHILDDILDFSKIESGGISLEQAPVSLRDIVEQVTSLFREQGEAKGIEIVETVEENFPQSVWGDSLRIRQVLANLVGNAVKFTSEGYVSVKVHTHTAGDGNHSMIIRVRDTGIGIDFDRQNRIFERFMQADNSTTREYGGTGLGLAISKKLVDLMNGSITVVSEKGEGTEFCVELPMRPAPGMQVMEKSSPCQSSLLALRILLAEDNVVNQKVAKAMLERLGCHVDLAVNGLEAIEATMTEEYDAILMDCHMPEIDGYEAARQIRRIGNSIPIIALTASVLAADRQRCEEAGMNAFVAKPVDFHELTNTLRNLAGPNKTTSLAS